MIQSFKDELELAKSTVTKHFDDSKKKRLIHIYGVAEMAMDLAKKYGLDPYKAGIAGYMHDYAKYDDFEKEKELLNEEDKKECEKYPFLYHAYLSAIAYKKYVGNDEDIYNAIRNHVFGRPGMSMLEAIIMISDYTEKNRTYESCIECRNILLDGDMDQAIYKSLLYTINHVKEQGDIPHPRQLEVFNEYKEKIKK